MRHDRGWSPMGPALHQMYLLLSISASSCAPYAKLYTEILCLLADPLGFDDPLLDIQVAARTRCWLDVNAATARFLRYSFTPDAFPTPCSTPSSAESTTTMERLDCLHAFVSVGSSVVMGSPSETPRLLPRSHLSCCSPTMPCLSGASDPVSDDEDPIPCLHVPSPRQPPAHATAASLAKSDDDIPIPRIPPRNALVLCDSEDEVLTLHRMRSCPSSTSHPFVCPCSAPQACGRCPLGYSAFPRLTVLDR
jgi:hypothetical protein